MQNGQFQIPGPDRLFVAMRGAENDFIVPTIRLPSMAIKRPFETIGMAGGGLHEICFGALDVVWFAEIHLEPGACIAGGGHPASAVRIVERELGREGLDASGRGRREPDLPIRTYGRCRGGTVEREIGAARGDRAKRANPLVGQRDHPDRAVLVERHFLGEDLAIGTAAAEFEVDEIPVVGAGRIYEAAVPRSVDADRGIGLSNDFVRWNGPGAHRRLVAHQVGVGVALSPAEGVEVVVDPFAFESPGAFGVVALARVNSDDRTVGAGQVWLELHHASAGIEHVELTVVIAEDFRVNG